MPCLQMREKPRKRKVFKGLTETTSEVSVPVSVPEQGFHSVREAEIFFFFTYIN